MHVAGRRVSGTATPGGIAHGVAKWAAKWIFWLQKWFSTINKYSIIKSNERHSINAVIFLKFIISIMGLFARSPKSLALPLFYTTGIGKTWTIFRILIGGPFRWEPFGKQERNTYTRIWKQIIRNQVARM